MKKKWYEKVDAYMIPKKKAGDYKRKRRIARNAAKKALKQAFPYVITDWHGSQDGEGVLALDSKGKLKVCIHLDPEGIEMIHEGIHNNNLLNILLEMNPQDSSKL